MTSPLEELQADNDRRLSDLASGKVGMPVQFPPGALDFVRLSVYLEALLDNVKLLPRAQFDFQMRVADLLDDVETQSRQAKLTNGAGLIQPTP